MNDMEAKIGMSVDEFLDHQSSSGGGGRRTNRLHNWRKEDPHKVVVWLHTLAGFVARWSHNWPRLVVRKDRETEEEVREIWGGSWVCHERELILTKQFFRGDNGEREYPPEVCPHCKMIEIVRLAVERGDIGWTEPLFRFMAHENDESPFVLTAGGIYNAFGKKDITPAEKLEIRRAGIKQSEAWKQNCVARCQYVFTVVEHDHPDHGILITEEAAALGKAMKKSILDEITRQGGGEEGRLKGNPLRNPYPFLWTYNKEESFANQYNAVAMSTVKMTAEVRELIVDTTPPELAEVVAPGNIAQLRADMERAALVDLPWDEIFGEAERVAKHAADQGDAPVAATPKQEKVPDVRSRPAQQPIAKKPTPPAQDDFPPEYGASNTSTSSQNVAPAVVPDDELFVCDHCSFDGLRATDVECPKCKSTYDECGNILTRPCVECRQMVPVGNEATTICPVCGQIHDVASWTAVAPPATQQRSRQQAARQQATPVQSPASPPEAAAPAGLKRRAIGGAKPASDDKMPWGTVR